MFDEVKSFPEIFLLEVSNQFRYKLVAVRIGRETNHGYGEYIPQLVTELKTLTRQRMVVGAVYSMLDHLKYHVEVRDVVSDVWLPFRQNRRHPVLAIAEVSVRPCIHLLFAVTLYDELHHVGMTINPLQPGFPALLT